MIGSYTMNFISIKLMIFITLFAIYKLCHNDLELKEKVQVRKSISVSNLIKHEPIVYEE